MPGYELIGEEERSAVNELFDRKSNFFCGKTVFEFQDDFRKMVGSKHAQAVTSCTAALKVAIEALELDPGSEIITSAFTFVATAEAIIDAGMIPVFAEIDNTYNIDPDKIVNKITPFTRAIIPVHMYGSPCDMDKIKKIAKEFDLKIIEDCAQGLASKYKGLYAGTIGDIGCFSFDAGKTLGTGDGGMIVSNNDKYYRRCYEFFDHGHQNNPDRPRGRDTRRRRGFNFRMTELQAAVGLAQLEKTDFIINEQKKNYTKIIGGLDNPIDRFRRFVIGGEHTYEAVIFSLPTKEEADYLYEKLKENKIITKNLPDAYDWHFAGTWDHIGVKEGFPFTKDLLERSIAIMIFVKMSDEHINKIIKTLNDFKGEKK